MSGSSDSEDDCYSNAALKLQKLKNKFKIENKVVKDSQKEIISQLSETKKVVPPPQSDLIDDLIANDGVLDEILAKNAPKRSTRSRRRRSKGAGVTDSDQTSSSNVKTKTKSPARGRKRGRIATPSPRGRSRGRRRPCCVPSIADFSYTSMPVTECEIPTYSVGNTSEYPDMSDNQALFSSKQTEPNIIDINESLEENEEISVKVYWQSTEFFKFMIRKFQKLTQIFEYFAKKENVSCNNLLFTYNERMLNCDDTPESIDYSVAKFIDGGIVNESVSTVAVRSEHSIKNGIKVKFQCPLVKKPFEIVISVDDNLSIGMLKCAEHIGKPLNKLKFQFDGDCISGKSTPKELDLEGGECIDVIILS